MAIVRAGEDWLEELCGFALRDGTHWSFAEVGGTGWLDLWSRDALPAVSDSSLSSPWDPLPCRTGQRPWCQAYCILVALGLGSHRNVGASGLPVRNRAVRLA
ncbi:hypothetical protein GCM10020229_34110 [Kitasatospora albolonga]